MTVPAGEEPGAADRRGVVGVWWPEVGLIVAALIVLAAVVDLLHPVDPEPPSEDPAEQAVAA